jgi:uncharacterized protein DUF6265
MAPRGGTMLSMGRTLRAGKLIEYELVLLAPDSSGALTYQAHPSGQSSASFRATQVTDTLLLFENPSHDFPTSIGYRKRSADSVIAWIAGMVNGQERRREFRYARVACGG